MIEYKTGNILAEDVEAVVNTVNCVGIMGRGIALQFKNTYPDNFKAYAAACKLNEVQPGRMFVYETGRLTNPRFVINFPTKRHWKAKSRIEDIDAGLVALVEEIRIRKISSIAIPPLGAGLGGLDWKQVRPRIEAALQGVEGLRVVIFEPAPDKADERANRSSDVPKMTPGRAALVGLMHRYLAGLLDPFITLLEVHKLMYFMQAAQEPLRLNYTKAPYGPYAENLRHVLRAVEGHLVSGYADGGDAPDKQLELVPGALVDAQTFLQEQPDTVNRMNRVFELVEGFETPFGLELLATVHWVVSQEQACSLEEVTARVYGWNDRKRQFTPRQIALAVFMLSKKGWIPSLAGSA
ncbi:type II toxin-antitoxin system antitoxin DNA ADP-ribosyl glycohydrolase DarG [Trichlorobacter lovleyi]|uniref:Appr-1-p processing domain protein n=1 Tax=Trichlorobacter lovleyi (strain ATCC BAA-1151 / DSM 17278 / SZ) TaxID=398767 RepID=B3E493_TRIL1|nr:macro domain-containing protein [Trichlorobacter lovleyi]ACD95914.1 Appr-1-p processing domain protein [Trichlorobacter lovleyi SZ]